MTRRAGRVVECARLESEKTRKGFAGSNPALSAKIKTSRSIVGIVARVSFPCGCFAVVAQGDAVIRQSDTRHLVGHVCADWKRHKYALAEAERDLAFRMRSVHRIVKGRVEVDVNGGANKAKLLEAKKIKT